MKAHLFVCLAVALTASTRADPAADLAHAVRHLAEAPNYTWILTPDAKVLNPQPSELRGARDGWQTARFLDQTDLWSVTDGKRRFNRLPGKSWVAVPVEPTPNHVPPGRPGTIADFVINLVSSLRNIRQEGDALVAEFDAEALTRELDFGHGAPANVSGRARFWVQEGTLLRYQTHREGTVRDRNGSRQFAATTEVLFTNIGSTEIVIPPDVRSLFDP